MGYLFQTIFVPIVAKRNKPNHSLVLVPSTKIGKAERAIQTISYWARKMMVHASIHWPDDNADSVRLWAFAVTHAAWLYNRLPNKNLGWMSPLEIFTATKSD